MEEVEVEVLQEDQIIPVKIINMVDLDFQIMLELPHRFQEQEVVMVMKTSAVAEVVDQTILHMKREATVVPE